METLFATSPDGTQIAYDVTGEGSPIILLHGGGQTRRDWHDTGYTERLKQNNKVITLDIRGNGESDKPTQSASYAIDKHCQDVLAVANACGIKQFALWGFSYGGNIGRYLTAKSTRVSKFIMIGVTFGAGASGEFRQYIIDFRDHWLPILQAQQDGSLDAQSLSPNDQVDIQNKDFPVLVTWLSALLDWGNVEPGELLCPALWLTGTRNDLAMAGIREYEAMLKSSKVKIEIVDGLDHDQEFSEIDIVLPLMLAFTQS